MVSVAGKGGRSFRQVCLKETNASEPLMTCRNVFHRRRNRDLDVYPASKGWEVPADGPTGVRHEGGVTLRQAPIRNTGTCRPDVKGDPQGSAAKPKRSVAVRVRVPMRGTGAEALVVGMKVCNGTGPKGRRDPALFSGQPERG